MKGILGGLEKTIKLTLDVNPPVTITFSLKEGELMYKSGGLKSRPQQVLRENIDAELYDKMLSALSPGGDELPSEDLERLKESQLISPFLPKKISKEISQPDSQEDSLSGPPSPSSDSNDAVEIVRQQRQYQERLQQMEEDGALPFETYKEITKGRKFIILETKESELPPARIGFGLDESGRFYVRMGNKVNHTEQGLNNFSFGLIENESSELQPNQVGFFLKNGVLKCKSAIDPISKDVTEGLPEPLKRSIKEKLESGTYGFKQFSIKLREPETLKNSPYNPYVKILGLTQAEGLAESTEDRDLLLRTAALYQIIKVSDVSSLPKEVFLQKNTKKSILAQIDSTPSSTVDRAFVFMNENERFNGVISDRRQIETTTGANLSDLTNENKAKFKKNTKLSYKEGDDEKDFDCILMESGQKIQDKQLGIKLQNGKLFCVIKDVETFELTKGSNGIDENIYDKIIGNLSGRSNNAILKPEYRDIISFASKNAPNDSGKALFDFISTDRVMLIDRVGQLNQSISELKNNRNLQPNIQKILENKQQIDSLLGQKKLSSIFESLMSVVEPLFRNEARQKDISGSSSSADIIKFLCKYPVRQGDEIIRDTLLLAHTSIKLSNHADSMSRILQAARSDNTTDEFYTKVREEIAERLEKSGVNSETKLVAENISRSSSPARSRSSDSGVTDRNSSEKSSRSPSPTNTIQVTRKTNATDQKELAQLANNFLATLGDSKKSSGSREEEAQISAPLKKKPIRGKGLMP
jgi:hypothetical protein